MKIRLFFSGLKEGSKLFGENLAVIINSVLLTLVYFIGIGLTSAIAQISGRHFLDVKIKNGTSYWSELNLSKKPMGDYYRQF